MDYATTYVALTYCKFQGPEYRPAPIWKCTRVGSWLVRHGLTSEPTRRRVEWYEHEINPLGKYLLKYGGGIPSLAWMKALLLLHVAHMLKTVPPSVAPMFVWTFMGLNVIYVIVVINNLYAIRRIEKAGHKIRVKKKRERVPFEDPLLPI